MAHAGNVLRKVKSIEKIDSLFLKPLLRNLIKHNIKPKVVITADHSTSCITRSHISAKVPWLICNLSGRDNCNANCHKIDWNEKTCRHGKKLKDGQLMKLVKNK
jgi:2,3-bisphosphoglycerate-independent phosphoglycerate mutase